VTSRPAWWQRGAIYQIYPRSFADANGDGVGDLAGIAGRLDDLEALGVEAIWLSPFYRSPMADFGYDVSDYRDVDPIFGTLADFDALLAAAHARGLQPVVIESFSSAELGLALGRENVIHAAVQPGGLAERLTFDAERLSGFRPRNESPRANASKSESKS